MKDRFTPQLQESLHAAYRKALAADSGGIEPLHLVAALAADDDGVLASVAAMGEVRIAALRQGLADAIGRLPKVAANEEELGLAPALRKVMNLGFKEVEKAGGGALDTDTLLGLCVAKDPAVGKVFKGLGLEPKRFAALHERARAGTAAGEEAAEAPAKKLRKYTVDLTAQAEEGLLDPVIGRDDEIRRAMQILQRRTKNNPLLIGEPGVGKTAVVEGLAQRIVAGEVPEGLRGRRLLSLDLGSMQAGASMLGQFEKRFKGVIEAVTAAPERYIIFIDEIHTLMDAGGMMDAANMLKPALARGELHCVGATTIDEYRKHIERDAALVRRFQRLAVEEPDAEAAISILRGLADRYALHHGVRITDAAVVAAVEMSQRYVSDGRLPDKALDLMDEAAAKLKIEQDSKPEEVDRLERRLAQLKMDEAALRRAEGADAAKRLDEHGKKVAAAERELAALHEEWRAEKAYFEKIKDAKEKIAKLRKEFDELWKKSDWEGAAKIKNEEIPRLEETIAAPRPRGGRRLLADEVGEREVAEVVARATGIPVSQMLDSHKQRVLGLEKHLRSRVIAQDEAAAAVAAAVTRAYAGMADRSRPLGCFMFLGSTGVGKTELSKELARYLFGGEKHLLRFDMSEYMESHSVARMIGAPPGYIGHDEGGQLTEAVRRRPYCVALFDEIEKAHPEVVNILLQVLDDGRLTDGRGRQVDFRNTVIIMTSNVGARALAEAADREEAVEAVRAQARDRFPPEFLNRLDDLIVFNPLDAEAGVAIARLQLEELKERLVAEKIDFAYDERAARLLAARGSGSEYGARPLKREMQRAIENPLAQRIVAGELRAGGGVRVSAADREFTFDAAPALLALQEGDGV
ncbi:MAG: AAA family ATPase [Betaproteobacteria bacterium AqS2]|uniref:Chaperone protein ClpB n=1 Tax=Candidatus Amphirhobacter heronislandensis TaxID=1732024 RepID=A0A930UJ37_9GAMM|nr:AAA family ATPase [Betaproteobacteria bacterium AqS2]